MLKQFFVSCAISAFFIFPFATMVAFKGECKHIYVEVQSANVDSICLVLPHPMIPINHNWVQPKVGSHNSNHDEKNMAEGISLVCVKCHHETKQKIHYTHNE